MAVVAGMDLRELGWLEAAKAMSANRIIRATKPTFFMPRRFVEGFFGFGLRGFLSMDFHYTPVIIFWLAL
jgi:hypothetical protein